MSQPNLLGIEDLEPAEILRILDAATECRMRIR